METVGGEREIGGLRKTNTGLSFLSRLKKETQKTPEEEGERRGMVYSKEI